MNSLLWALQVLLALWNLVGGGYEAMNYETLKGSWVSGLPNPVWVGYGVLQVLFALGLVLPKFVPIAAFGLAVLSLLGCALFAKYAGFPGVLWGLVPALLAAFVAYGRSVPKPL